MAPPLGFKVPIARQNFGQFCSYAIFFWENFWSIDFCFLEINIEPEKPSPNWHNDLFFWRSPRFRQKNSLNFGEDIFFFGDHLDLDRKIVSISVKTFFLEITLILTEKMTKSE